MSRSPTERSNKMQKSLPDRPWSAWASGASGASGALGSKESNGTWCRVMQRPRHDMALLTPVMHSLYSHVMPWCKCRITADGAIYGEQFGCFAGASHPVYSNQQLLITCFYTVAPSWPVHAHPQIVHNFHPGPVLHLPRPPERSETMRSSPQFPARPCELREVEAKQNWFKPWPKRWNE